MIARDSDGQPVYRNLPHLRKRLLVYSSMLTLEDVQGTEPEVRVTTRYVLPTPQQAALYAALQVDGVATHNGGLLTADTTLSLATRLCQVVGGFVPTDDDPVAASCTPDNPKVAEVITILDELGPDEKVVIWCRFTAEINAVVNEIAFVHGAASVVQYDGSTSAADRTTAKLRFVRDPACRYFVGQVKAGGTGVDGLQAAAHYMIFYSNDYSYTIREQAIARLARIAGSLVVNVIDLMMDNTVDCDVVRCMQTAQDVHATVLRKHVEPVALPVK